MTEEQADELIEAFYVAILVKERDEMAALNEGLHTEAIHKAGLALFEQLTKDNK